MQWCDFYADFWDWSDATRRTRISSLEDIGPGEEIVEVIWEIEDPKVRSQLVRKAMKLGAKFTKEDLLNLDTELPDALFEQLAAYAQVNTDALYFSKSSGVWDNFANDAQIAQLEQDVDTLCDQVDGHPAAPKRRPGFFGKSVAIPSGAFSSFRRSKKKSSRCDGDCANCPAHYGYRYGRWYYGHGHMHGCERDGNGGASGRTYRD